MRAWVVDTPGPVTGNPLRLTDRPPPEPGPGEVRVRVSACGVCRTGRENLCPAAAFTGWDADGGYAEFAVVPEAYAYQLPDAHDDVTAAPLLCVGIVGYRALRRSELPPGGRLGIYGFGASAHVVAQVALAQGATVHVLTRSVEAQRLALDLGAASAGPAEGAPPEPLDAAVLFAPVGDGSPRPCPSARGRRPGRWPRRTGCWPISRPTGSPAPPSSFLEPQGPRRAGRSARRSGSIGAVGAERCAAMLPGRV